MGEGEGEENTENSILADKLFGSAFADVARKHLEKARDALARGADEQAREHLNRVALANARALTNLTSQRLTDEENKEWLMLQRRKYRVSDTGMISTNFLDERSEARLRYLGKKAIPPKEEENK